MQTNTIEQIKKFQDFIYTNYYNMLLENIRKGTQSLLIDFAELSKYDPDLATELLDSPEETIKAIEKTIEQFDVEHYNFKIRLFNLPGSQKIKISDIRSNHLNKLVVMHGIIRQKSDVRPQTTSSRFECPTCGSIMNILQFDITYKEPTRCGCGRKVKFILLDEELVDAQGIVIEESSDNLEGSEQPKRINVVLTQDLVSPIGEKRLAPGSKVEVTGIVKKIPIILKTGGKSTRFELFIDTVYISPMEDTFYDITITEEEEKEIFVIAKDPEGYGKLVNSIAPSIYGYEKIKEALLLQLVGGERKVRSDDIISRGDTHILLCGDPGAGKSAILKRITKIAPKGRYVSGKGASGIGITAAVVRDEFTKGWALEAGAMALSNDGMVCLDEMDKMDPADRSAMHECLENQSISISKANIQATLQARTTVLAAANPKFGRFDPYGIIADQIDLPPTLINRFDLIFPIKDIPNKEHDKNMTKHILNLHQNPTINEPEIPTILLRKFVAYARQRIHPKLSSKAVEEINNFYLEMRQINTGESSELKPIPISARQLEALVRLSEASAKTRLSNEVTIDDAKKAIELIKYCLQEVGFDKETGKIDIDRIATGIPTTERNLVYKLREIINELSEQHKENPFPVDEIYNHKSIAESDHAEIEEILSKMFRSGDIYEARRGFIKKF